MARSSLFPGVPSALPTSSDRPATWRSDERSVRLAIRQFLVAAQPGSDASTGSLAWALFATGAAEAIRERAGLDPRADARIEKSLLTGLFGPGRSNHRGWRRAMRHFAATSKGGRLHREGRLAMLAWLAGEAPAARFQAAVLGAKKPALRD